MRSLTPNFFKKSCFVLLGPNHPHPEKAGFSEKGINFDVFVVPPVLQQTD